MSIVTRKATPEEALRLIHYEAWCEEHSSPAQIACAALMDDLYVDTRRVTPDSPEEASHHCPQCHAAGAK